MPHDPPAAPTGRSPRKMPKPPPPPGALTPVAPPPRGGPSAVPPAPPSPKPTLPIHRGPVETHPFIQALHTPLPQPKAAPLYITMLVLVAALMVLLPAVYLLCIYYVGYGVYWHAVHNVTIFEGAGSRSAKGALLLYLAPIIAGGVLVVFMIKPLFAPRRRDHEPHHLYRQNEPLLFAYVDRLCDTVGAPRPAAIHVDMDLNASASFASFFSGVLGGKLVLTLGLPLVAGMSLNDLTGVLAHEFGHFAQRSAMRLSYLIRTINMWFARVVYERDAWDQALESAQSNGGHIGIVIVAAITRGAVWLSRRVLWLLMVIGDLASSLLLRQMEFDADRYSARTVGSTAAATMLGNIPVLDLAIKTTFNDLSDALAEKRLPDNVPALVTNRVRDFPADVRQQLAAAIAAEKTGWFASHPATGQRIAALHREPESPLVDFSALPAAGIFSNFTALATYMTRQFYDLNLGQQMNSVQLVPVATIEAKREEVSQQAASLTTFFADLLDPFRPVFPQGGPLPGNRDTLAAQLVEARAGEYRCVPAAQPATVEYDRLDVLLLRLEQVVAVANAGVTPTPDPGLRLSSLAPAAIGAKRAEITGGLDAARRPIDAALAFAMRRIDLALSLGALMSPLPPRPAENSYELADSPDDTPVSRLLGLLRAFSMAAPLLIELRKLHVQQAGLLSLVQKHSTEQVYVDTVLSFSRKLCSAINTARGPFQQVPYPFADPSRPISCDQFIFAPPTPDENVGDTFEAAERALSQAFQLYLRAMGALADHAQRVEERLGLSPMPFSAIPKPPGNA